MLYITALYHSGVVVLVLEDTMLHVITYRAVRYKVEVVPRHANMTELSTAILYSSISQWCCCTVLQQCYRYVLYHGVL